METSKLFTVKENDYEKYPYRGICGKCGCYHEKLNKDCLCIWCKMAGVKKLTTDPLPEDILRFVKPRF